MTLNRAIAIVTACEAVTGWLVIGFIITISQISGLVEFAAYLVALVYMLGKERGYKWLSTQHEKRPIPPYLIPVPTLALIAGIAAGFILAPEAMRAEIIETLARDTLWLVLLAVGYGVIAYTGLVETVWGSFKRYS